MPDTMVLQPDDLLPTARLYKRRPRAPALESELSAHRELSSLMTVDPELAIQRFLDLASSFAPPPVPPG